MGPDASKAAASATVNHHQNTPQNQTKTQRHTTHENCLTLLSEALKEEVITLPRQRPDCIWRGPDASKAAASATVSHHQNTPQNQTKTQRHTTHENCLTLLSEALKERLLHCQGNDQTASGEDGSRRIQSSRFRNSKPPSEHAPKPDKNAAPHHPRKLPNVAF